MQGYNTQVKRFPNVLLAGWFGFQAKPYFTAKAGTDTPPAVQFDVGGKPAAAQ